MDVLQAMSVIKNFAGNAGRGTCNDILYEALQVALSAMEKQNPRKMKERHYEEPGEAPIIKYTCPCGCRIQPMRSSNYCRICGQALDWNSIQ